MPSAWPWNLPSRNNKDYHKQLEGVKLTPQLKKLLQECVNKCQKENALSDNITTTSTTHFPTNMSLAQATTVLTNLEEAPVLPLSALQAIATILLLQQQQQQQQQSEKEEDTETMAQKLGALNDALQNQSLVFTPPPPAANNDAEKSDADRKEAMKWEKRMNRLRLRAEETRYRKLTKNLHNGANDDDVTAKSMMYAASIGLNMIIAPITFGVFMYFFAGHLFTWFSPDEDDELNNNNNNNTKKMDIQKTIAGVVGGVLMLFVEMILFVIRTHSMDQSIRKKQKTKKLSPFGYTKPKAPPTAITTTETIASKKDN